MPRFNPLPTYTTSTNATLTVDSIRQAIRTLQANDVPEPPRAVPPQRPGDFSWAILDDYTPGVDLSLSPSNVGEQSTTQVGSTNHAPPPDSGFRKWIKTLDAL